MKQTAVVILNYNGAGMLRRFLPSVIKYSPEASIYVADNGSSDESCDVVRNEFPAVKLMVLDHNYGFAEGYNRALAQVDEEYAVLLNSDVEVTRGWLSPMTEEGLQQVRTALAAGATRQTAVACYRNDGGRCMKLLWVVGSRRSFGPEGRFPVGRRRASTSRPTESSSSASPTRVGREVPVGLEGPRPTSSAALPHRG